MHEIGTYWTRLEKARQEYIKDCYRVLEEIAEKHSVGAIDLRDCVWGTGRKQDDQAK